VSDQGHLKRLEYVWGKQPVYFITTCVAERKHRLATSLIHGLLREEWKSMLKRHGWAVGRYVIMPDHVHFFVSSIPANPKPLSQAVGKWKEWTAKKILQSTGESSPLWQAEFFDHLLRSDESRQEKWMYVRENPVRAGLVANADDWTYAGALDFE
jgi:putative transposase